MAEIWKIIHSYRLALVDSLCLTGNESYYCAVCIISSEPLQEPDISVICDKNKLDDCGCNGAPDWIIEVTSPSDPQRDYGIKLFKYRTAGVREYWIVNPQKKTVMVYDFEKDQRSNQYNFEDDISACIYGDLIINMRHLVFSER